MSDKTFIEFFAGMGLMRLGLEQAGWRCVFANDIDPLKAHLYRTHFQDDPDHFHLGDVHALAPASVPDALLATASFPCTDLSLAGKRAGLSGAQSSAFWGFVRVLDALGARRPPYLLIENVPAFLSANQGKDIRSALEALSRLGYALDAFVLDAVHFVPQSRKRLFVVGLPFDGVERASSPLPDACSLRPPHLLALIRDTPYLPWRLRALPPLPRRQTVLADLMEVLPENHKAWWDEERTAYLLSQVSERRLQEMARRAPAAEYRYFTAFRRRRATRTVAEVRSDGIAGCLRTPKGGSARQILLQVGGGRIRVRLLTPLECARLMGAGDFTLGDKSHAALFGLGDAVCVPAITWIGQAFWGDL